MNDRYGKTAKTIFTVVILISLSLSSLQADDRPTVYSLVGKPVVVSDGWAGQSFTLMREGAEYYILRDIFGSGLPVIDTLKYRVSFAGEYRILFPIPAGSADNRDAPEFAMQIDENGAVRIFMNGIELVVNRIDNRRPEIIRPYQPPVRVVE